MTVEGDELRRVYDGLWTLTDVPGAVSTAALLMWEADRKPSYRCTVCLNGPQSAAFRRALDHFASPP